MWYFSWCTSVADVVERGDFQLCTIMLCKSLGGQEAKNSFVQSKWKENHTVLELGQANTSLDPQVIDRFNVICHLDKLPQQHGTLQYLCL